MPSHKSLKSVAHNILESYISLMNYFPYDYFLGHLLTQVRKTRINRLTIDILLNKAEPVELLTIAIRACIKNQNRWVPKLVKNAGSTIDFISSAIMIIEFDLQRSRPYANDNKITENYFVSEIVIIDDRGKKYVYKHEGWWFPETTNEFLNDQK